MDIVRVMCRADGAATPHDGRYVVDWNPHTPFGVCDITTTPNEREATRFPGIEAWVQWKTISTVEPTRPDGKPNRPLAGLTVEMIKVVR